jgi:sialic acid synthase SpsE
VCCYGYKKVANRKVGKDNRPCHIAEMSGSHNQSLDYALKIVEAAAQTDLFSNHEKPSWQ